MDKVAELVNVYWHCQPKEANLFYDQHRETFLALNQAIGKYAPAVKHLVNSLNPKELGP